MAESQSNMRDRERIEMIGRKIQKIGEKEKEKGREEEKRKVGRPSKIEWLGRERASSLPIADWLKRAEKKKERGEGRRRRVGILLNEVQKWRDCR